MKNLFPICFACAACLWNSDSLALDISIGSTSVQPGNTATVDVVFSNVPTNPISAFAIYLSSTSSFGVPSVSVGVQPNVTLFVDDFNNGVYRVTGLVMNGSGIGNGIVAHLSFAVPSNANAGVYPIAIAAVPRNAPPGANPETRALVTSDALPGTATGGSITVSSGAVIPPTITGITRQFGGAMLLTINGESGVSYGIEASTNFTQWQQIFSTNTTSSSFQFADVEATNYTIRFYRVRSMEGP